MEACRSRVHMDETQPLPAGGLSREPWRLWVRAQCLYHEGDYPSESLGWLLQSGGRVSAAGWWSVASHDCSLRFSLIQA